MKRIVIELGIGEKTNIGEIFYLIENNFTLKCLIYLKVWKWKKLKIESVDQSMMKLQLIDLFST